MTQAITRFSVMTSTSTTRIAFRAFFPTRSDMTPAVLSTIALRLQKLGYLSGPTPSTYDGRFQQAVRRFQRAVGGLHEDGVSGPRTVMALSRVAGGLSSPSTSVPADERVQPNCQATFIDIGIIGIKPLRDDQPEHAVAQKFQPLVRLRADAGVRERKL